MSQSKYKLFINKDINNIEETEKHEQRLSEASYYVKRLNSKSKWSLKQNIKRLYFYLDFDFVKQALMNLHRITEHQEIRKTIEDAHNNSIDVSEVLKDHKQQTEYEEALARVEKEILTEGLKEETEGIPSDNSEITSMLGFYKYNAQSQELN